MKESWGSDPGQAPARRSTDDYAAMTSMFRTSNPVPGLEHQSSMNRCGTRSSNCIPGRGKIRPQQEAQYASVRSAKPSQPSKAPCNTGGIHTRPSQGSAADLEAALRKIDRENVDAGHVLLLLQRIVARVWHFSMPSKGGHTSHQFIAYLAPMPPKITRNVFNAISTSSQREMFLM